MLHWHDPAEGLKTIHALLVRIGSEEIARGDRDGLFPDLKQVAGALTRAESKGI